MGEIVSEANFSLTMVAGHPVALSRRLLAFRDAPGTPPLAPHEVWFTVTHAPSPASGRLVFGTDPAQQISGFSQGDLNEHRLLFVPTQSLTSPPVAPLKFEFQARHATTGQEIALPVTIQIHVRAPSTTKPTFRIPAPKLRLEQMSQLEIGMQYFEIDGIDNLDPNLIFVISDIPTSGSLLYVNDKNASLRIYEGYEFYLGDVFNGSIRYVYSGEKKNIEDTFEVLATDGNFELTNVITLEIIATDIEDNLKIEKLMKSSSSVRFYNTPNYITVYEYDELLKIPIERDGNIDFNGYVRCFTSLPPLSKSKHALAIPEEDFEPRLQTSPSSVISFPSGKSQHCCEVRIINDEIYEGAEEFYLNLEAVNGSGISIKEKSFISVRIVDPEDVPTVQFEYEYLTIPDFTSYVVKRITVNVIRTGDVSAECSITVSTRDGNATESIDYEAFSKKVVFGRGVSKVPIHVNILSMYTRKTMSQFRYFTILINPSSMKGAHLGRITTVTIGIEPFFNEPMLKMFPLQPLVVSLKHYRNITNISNTDIPPGYPLVCVSSCDRHHPQFNATEKLCLLSGISVQGNNTMYAWEVVPLFKGTSHRSHEYSSFHEIQRNTIYGDVNSKILDPSLFGPKHKVRCRTAATSDTDTYPKMEFPLASNFIIVGDDDLSICPHRSFRYDKTPAEYMAQIQFVNESLVTNFRNKVHIYIEIVHKDGILPIISTSPIVDLKSSLTYKQFKYLHECSNLPHGMFLHGTYTKQQNHTVWSKIEKNSTKHLYSHLNTTTCKWTFEAWFSINELVESCHGTISSQYEDTRSNHNWMSVQVPLYIALYQAEEPIQYHQTVLQVSFFYTSSLGTRIKGTHSEANLQERTGRARVVRVGGDPEGRLRLSVETRALFPGLFVLHHPGSPEARAALQPPAEVPSPFTLAGVPGSGGQERIHARARGALQLWTARSAFAMQDFSGEYWLTLIPCWRDEPSAEWMEKEREGVGEGDGWPACTPRPPVRLPLHVHFRRAPAPPPLRTRLAARLLLARSPPPPPPSRSTPLEVQEWTGEFARSDAVYAFVQLQPPPSLKASEPSQKPPPPDFSLRIETVVLCSAPRQAPPLAGCDAHLPSRHSHIVRLLDREKFEMKSHWPESHFNASFASDFTSKMHYYEYPGFDGFTFLVEPMYVLDAEDSQWYLEVTYSLKFSTSSRSRRSVKRKTKKHEIYEGSALRVLKLQKYPQDTVNNISQIWQLTFGPALVLLFIPLAIVVLFTHLHRVHNLINRNKSAQVQV